MADENAPAEDTEEVLRGWADLELERWHQSPLTGAETEASLYRMAENDHRICLFRIADGTVSIDPALLRLRPAMADPACDAGHRAAAYRALFEDAIRTFAITGSVLQAMYVADGYPDTTDGPLFCFQKPVGASGILVPDIDLLSYDYCLDHDGRFDDPVAFDRKRPEAIFIGATTGRKLARAADVANGTNQRVAAALYFKGKDGVTFDLPAIVQCSTKVEEALRSAGIGGRRWTWREQQDFRYMLSLDGNGATCSRVAAALHGRQVLAKYASDNLLYYFHGLQPWRHYVPIAAHADVLLLVADAGGATDRHRGIAREGRHFAQRFLTRLPILRYTALLLGGYIARFGEGGSVVGPLPPLIDCTLRRSGLSPSWGPSDETGRIGTTPIECTTLFPYGLAARDIECSGIDGLGRTYTVPAGERCGEQGWPLHGLRLRLTGAAARRWTVIVQERFADGTTRRRGARERLVPANAPLTGFSVALRPRSKMMRSLKRALGRMRRFAGRSPTRMALAEQPHSGED